jgi:hypothetical protein
MNKPIKKEKQKENDTLIKHKALINLDDYSDINTIGHQLICEVVIADEKQISSLIMPDEVKKNIDISKMYSDHPERAIVKCVGEQVNPMITSETLVYYMAPNPRMLLVKDKIMLVLQDYDIISFRNKK